MLFLTDDSPISQWILALQAHRLWRRGTDHVLGEPLFAALEIKHARIVQAAEKAVSSENVVRHNLAAI
jgi:hypothetical protein